MRPSWAGSLFSAASVMTFCKRIYSNDRWLAAYIAYRKRVNDRPRRPAPFTGQGATTRKRTEQGMEIFVRESPESDKETIVLYLHGSGYVMQPTWFHWRFFGRLARELRTEVVMPIYPKAPVHHFGEASEKLIACYRQLLERKKKARIVVIGDSSGGAVALALTQEAVRLKLPLPERLILISPLLDSSLRRPEIQEIEQVDLLQTKKVLRAFGKAWAGGETLTHPAVSPLYGPLSSLPPVSILIGTRDLLFPDSAAWVSAVRAAGGEAELLPYERMIHDFPLLPIPEAKHAMKRIAELARQSSARSDKGRESYGVSRID
ncbi:esterase [Saccharibacillus sp. O23]|uniref:alpha/beta hydrolase n=1 Tax=Saccharibacillus sp. O23 TaxID=2009338 RepID=UPI000B4E5739|nr:alpha/beta hydrolase [Saccharibacillus sp. O23]OWR32418.1 esterase [Saccharibacillus sp. O23]